MGQDPVCIRVPRTGVERNSGPEFSSACSGPEVLSSCSSPGTPSACSGLGVPSAYSGSGVPSACNGPEVPSSFSGPEVSSACSSRAFVPLSGWGCLLPRLSLHLLATDYTGK